MDDKLQQVLHKVELLCEQNPEFASALREKLGAVAAVSNSVGAGFASAMRLQHERCRKKARNYYREITDDALRKDLVNYYASMLWYKSIFEVGQYFVNVNYQVENMLNHYLSKTDFHKKVEESPTRYCSKLEINPKYIINIDAYTYAFDKSSGERIVPSRINSLWVKIYYWAVDTEQVGIMDKYKIYLNAIVSVRNEVNHANSASQKQSLKYWQEQEDSLQFAFVEAVIKQIRKSIIELQQTA